MAGHALGLPVFGILMGAEPLHAALEGGIVGAIALLTFLPRASPRIQTVIASFGLMSCSAILTHLSGGYIEAHFHFFVMLGVIFLYEDWLPYVLSVAYVALHHGVAGTLDPASVFNHPSAIADPWPWAGIHALFIVGLSTALIIAWNVIDRSRQAERNAQDAEKRALAEARDLRRQIGAQEKMAALGTLVAGLAHEVRTPLTIVSTNAALIELKTKKAAMPAPTAEGLTMHVREIHSSVERMNSLVLQLRKFHRLGGSDREDARLDAVVKEAVDLFLAANRVTPHIRVELDRVVSQRLNVLGVQQVVLNLLSNAVDAVDPAAGRVAIRTTQTEAGPALIVTDNGVGMTPDALTRAFDPLFTTKKDGTGLGLSIVKRIVDDHRGSIHIASVPSEGTTITVQFAPTPKAAVAMPVALDASDAAHPTERPTASA